MVPWVPETSSAVSGFCQVLIVACGFGLRPKMCRPSGNTENSRGTREKPLVPRVKKMDTPAGKLYCTFCFTRKVSMVMFINPLSPKSDQHQISPYDISTQSGERVMRIIKMIT